MSSIPHGDAGSTLSFDKYMLPPTVVNIGSIPLAFTGYGKTFIFPFQILRRSEGWPFSPDFSPRVWKGGALAPPLRGVLEYSHVPRPRSLQPQAAGARDEQRAGGVISAGLKPRPSSNLQKRPSVVRNPG